MNGNVDGEKAPAARTCVGNRYRFDTRPSPMALKPSRMATRSRLYTLYGSKTSDGKVKTVQNLRGFPPSPCCGSVRGRHPLKTVLKLYWKPTWKSVNLQDTTPHEPRPGAPGPHYQVLQPMGAAFEPPTTILAPVVLGGCLGCSIWSINSKRRTLRTMGVP
jgi:hypothetical protein